MTEDTRRRAEAAQKDIEDVTSVVLPEPGQPPVSLDAADPQTSEEIRRRMDELDMSDSGSIVRFGTRRTGRIAGNQPAHAGRCQEQGCRPRR